MGKGEIVQGYYLLKYFSLRTTNANKRYYDLTLADRTGEINCKIWDTNMVKDIELSDGIIVKVRGLVNEWQGGLQLKVERIRLLAAEEDLKIEDFVPAAPHPAEEMLADLFKYIDKIRDQDIKKITTEIINENREKLLHYPAAMKNHHSIRSGLLYHILTMLKMAERVMEVYSYLNSDYLYAGVLLHDIAKIDEMDASELGVVSSYTTEGVLLGHIIQGIKDIERVGRELDADNETIILLQHLVLSHHYEPEFGSPKRPMIPEGEILHFLDLIDARMYDMQKALGPVKAGGFSDKVWLLHNRKMYKPLGEDTL
ncbi:MAG TPA: HD domain-containing protein [Bacillota bacterium]|nr:HD domain-containing protein [Bacillota bacterium]